MYLFSKMFAVNANQIGNKCNFVNLFHQRFPIPSNIVFYMAKNPSSPSLWKKLIRTCKYFYSRSPIFVVDSIIFSKSKVSIRYEKDKKYFRVISLSQISCKFWILQTATYFHFNDLKIRILRDKMFQINGFYFKSIHVKLEENLPSEILKNVKSVCFDEAVPEHADGAPMSLETVFKFFPNLEVFNL